MHERDWKRFIEEGAEGKTLAIAQLPDHLNSLLGSPDSKVHLRHDYALKSVRKHGFGPKHFPLIFETIDGGIVIQDKPGHLTMFYFDENDTKEWYQVTVKCCASTKLNVVTTFHRQNVKEVRRHLKRWPAIQRQK